MTGVKRIKRKRGRPVVQPDYLYGLFHGIEGEMVRTGQSAKRVCEFIIKEHGPLVLFDEKTGKTVVIKNAKTLRSRYVEVRAALSTPSSPLSDAEVIALHLQKSFDGLPMVQASDGKILGQWGPTKKSLRARRQALLARRQTKLHNK